MIFVAADWLVALLDSLSTRRKSGSKGMEIFFAVDEEEIGRGSLSFTIKDARPAIWKVNLYDNTATGKTTWGHINYK